MVSLAYFKQRVIGSIQGVVYLALVYLSFDGLVHQVADSFVVSVVEMKELPRR